jgi:hypothetical protein
MSSGRRSANEVNILDMLDRQASGPLPRRMLRRFLGRSAMVWYGAAGLLVCGLVGTLAWLARDGTPSSVDNVLAGSIKPSAQVEVVSETVGNAPLVASVANHAPAAEGVPDSAADSALTAAPATIVDVAPPPEPAAQAPVPAPVVHALPPQQATGRIAAREVPRDPPRLAAHAAAPKAAPRTGRSASQPRAETAASRHRRQAAAAKAPPAAPAVDTDVALITAIIQHAANRQEAEEGGCVDKGCSARKP